MVYLFDEGSVFDVSLDKLWEYLPSDAHKHPSSNVISREREGNTVTITSERNFNGKVATVKLRITLHPPLGTVQEYLEGPAAGSKSFAYYTPKGDKTSITVVGDFKMAGVSGDEATRAAAMQMLEASFNEDVATLSKLK
jgi:hypothetical protein